MTETIVTGKAWRVFVGKVTENIETIDSGEVSIEPTGSSSGDSSFRGDEDSSDNTASAVSEDEDSEETDNTDNSSDSNDNGTDNTDGDGKTISHNKFIKISFWKVASDVYTDNTKNLEETVGKITGITDSLTSTSSNVAASALTVKTINDKLVALKEKYDL
jgi:hypothetical protein